MIFSVILLLVGLSSWLPLTLILLGLMGASGIVFTASANTGLQMSTPGELRGRVMSLYFLLFAGTTPIGGFLVGVLAARFGVQPTVALMGVFCIVGVAGAMAYAWWAKSRTRQPLVAAYGTPAPAAAPQPDTTQARNEVQAAR